VENALAELEGREPMPIAGATPPAGAPAQGQGAAPSAVPGGMPPPAPDRDVPTNASTDFQRQAQKPVVTHPIVGPKVVSFEWSGPAKGRVMLADFPMDKMPPFARAKFLQGMAGKIAALAEAAKVEGPVTLDLVDQASGNVMDTLSTGAAGSKP
jgi:uncharacterized protein (DUF3820 family)